MTRREKLENKKDQNLTKIKELKEKDVEFRRELILLSDKDQWFTEIIEKHDRPKYAREDHFLNNKLVGRIYWNEDFIDEDSGEVITIERTQVVRINSEWQ